MIYQGSELELFAEAHRWKRYMADSIRPYLGGRVLEVGAGIGGTTRFLCTGREESWTCVEPDPSLAAKIEESMAAGTLPANCSVHCGTLASMAPESRFDTIIYIDVLEHIEDDASEVARAASRLSPNGNLVVLSPAHPWLFSPFDEAVGHYRRYTKATIAAIGAPGLQRTKSFYLDSVGMLASLGNRLLLRQAVPTVSEIAIWDRYMVSMSRVLDVLTGRRLGRAVVAVWTKPPH